MDAIAWPETCGMLPLDDGHRCTPSSFLPPISCTSGERESYFEPPSTIFDCTVTVFGSLHFPLLFLRWYPGPPGLHPPHTSTAPSDHIHLHLFLLPSFCHFTSSAFNSLICWRHTSIYYYTVTFISILSHYCHYSLRVLAYPATPAYSVPSDASNWYD